MENFIAHFVFYDPTAALSMDSDLLSELISIPADQHPVFGSLHHSSKKPKPMYNLDTSAAMRR